MNPDLSTLTGGPRGHITVDGERYAVYELKLSEMGELQAWVDSLYGDYLELARAAIGKGLTPSQEQYLLRAALELGARPKALLGTPEADTLVRSAEGTKMVLWLSIRKGRPGFSRADADRLFGAMTPLQIARAFEASGTEAVITDPKAPTPSGPTTPPS